MLRKALAMNPPGIDPNFFYGDFLAGLRPAAEATAYLQRALQAPARPGRRDRRQRASRRSQGAPGEGPLTAVGSGTAQRGAKPPSGRLAN